MDVTVQTHRSHDSNDMYITTKFQDTLAIDRRFGEIVLGEIAEKVAARYVEEHFAEIAALLDQNAIANLAIADAGKKIAEEIRAQPTVLHDKETRTEVYDRGFFGGTRRVR